MDGCTSTTGVLNKDLYVQGAYNKDVVGGGGGGGGGGVGGGGGGGGGKMEVLGLIVRAYNGRGLKVKVLELTMKVLGRGLIMEVLEGGAYNEGVGGL